MARESAAVWAALRGSGRDTPSILARHDLRQAPSPVGSGRRPIGLSRMNPSPATIARTSGCTSSASRAARTSPSAATGASARTSVRSSTAARSARPAAVSAPSAVQQPPPGQPVHAGRPLVLGPAAAGAHPVGIHRDVGGEQDQRLDRVQAGGEQGGDVAVAPLLAQHRLGVPQHEVRRLRPGQGRVRRTERPARGRRGERGLAGERGGLGHGGRFAARPPRAAGAARRPPPPGARRGTAPATPPSTCRAPPGRRVAGRTRRTPP